MPMQTGDLHRRCGVSGAMWANARIMSTQAATIRLLMNKGKIMKPSNKVRHLVLSVLVAAGAVAVPAFAQVSVNINLGPPAPLYEVRPVIAPGYTWAPGYWTLNGDRHIWVRGRTIVQREGYRWAPITGSSVTTSMCASPAIGSAMSRTRPSKLKNKKNPSTGITARARAASTATRAIATIDAAKRFQK
jgi:hypothetical protein